MSYRSQRNHNRQQYAAPSRNSPRLCNQCQAPLSCCQLAYCADCCYCKACTSHRQRLQRGQLRVATDRMSIDDEEPLFGLNDLYASEQELDGALDHLQASQKSLSEELGHLLDAHNKKRKLRRNDALLGPAAKKIRDFLDRSLPLPPVDAEAVKSELAQMGVRCPTDCKCPEGTHSSSPL